MKGKITSLMQHVYINILNVSPFWKAIFYNVLCYEETRFMLLAGLLFSLLMDFTPSESLISPTGNKPLVTPVMPH